LQAIFTFFAVKYKETPSAIIAAIFSSNPCKGNNANAPPSPKTPSNGIVQTGHPDASAPVKALHALEPAPFRNPKLPVICFLQMIRVVVMPVKTAIADPKATVVTVNVIPYILMYSGSGVKENVRYQNNAPNAIEIMALVAA